MYLQVAAQHVLSKTAQKHYYTWYTPPAKTDQPTIHTEKEKSMIIRSSITYANTQRLLRFETKRPYAADDTFDNPVRECSKTLDERE